MGESAGIVLAGGRSRRMGAAKADLDWHGLSFVTRITGILERAVDGPVIVVAARDQDIAAASDRVEVARDAHDERGPLEGLAAGLRAIGDRASRVFVSSTDAPMLHPAFVRTMLEALEGHDVAVPESSGYRHPLAAAYRVSVLDEIDRLLSADQLRPAFLYERVPTRVIDEQELHALLGDVDPELRSLQNVNTPADYEAALGIPLPEIQIECFGGVQEGPQRVLTHAAPTVAAAARAARVRLDAHVAAALNGEQITRSGTVPLVAGDIVTFMSADAGG